MDVRLLFHFASRFWMEVMGGSDEIKQEAFESSKVRCTIIEINYMMNDSLLEKDIKYEVLKVVTTIKERIYQIGCA